MICDFKKKSFSSKVKPNTVIFFTNYAKHVVLRKSLRFDNFLLFEMIIKMFIFVVNLFRSFIIIGVPYFSVVGCTFSIYASI